MKDKIIPEFFRRYGLNYVWGAIFLLINVYIATLSPKYLGIIIDLLDTPVINQQEVLKYIALMLLVLWVSLSRDSSGVILSWAILVIWNAFYVWKCLSIFRRCQ